MSFSAWWPSRWASGCPACPRRCPARRRRSSTSCGGAGGSPTAGGRADLRDGGGEPAAAVAQGPSTPKGPRSANRTARLLDQVAARRRRPVAVGPRRRERQDDRAARGGARRQPRHRSRLAPVTLHACPPRPAAVPLGVGSRAHPPHPDNRRACGSHAGNGEPLGSGTHETPPCGAPRPPMHTASPVQRSARASGGHLSRGAVARNRARRCPPRRGRSAPRIRASRRLRRCARCRAQPPIGAIAPAAHVPVVEACARVRAPRRTARAVRPVPSQTGPAAPGPRRRRRRACWRSRAAHRTRCPSSAR